MRFIVFALVISILAVTPVVTFAQAAKPVAVAPAPVEKNTSPFLHADSNVATAADNGSKTTSSLITDAPLKSDYVMGKASAPVTMVEYASLSCPHCAHFSNNVLPELEKKYIQTGKLRYILRQFPLNDPALKGAILLECVGEQDRDKYYVFSRVLFDAQNKWAFDGNYMAGLETIASVGGLSKEQFASCMSNTDREMKVLQAKKIATDELKIPHTPYMFINNEIYEGNRSIEAISKFIDEKLAAAKNSSK